VVSTVPTSARSDLWPWSWWSAATRRSLVCSVGASGKVLSATAVGWLSPLSHSPALVGRSFCSSSVPRGRKGTVALTYHLATFEFLTLARATQALGPRLSKQMTVENPVKRTLTPHPKRVMPSESNSRQLVPPIAIIQSSTTFISQRYIISSAHSSGTHHASSTYFATVRHKIGNNSPFSIQTSSRPAR
jgi:hypothetical protein